MEKAKFKIIKDGDFITIKFKGKKYLYVDRIEIDSKVYVQFSSIKSSIFFEKVKDEYYIIDNLEVLNKLYEYSGLDKKDVYYSKFKEVLLFPIARDLETLDNETRDKLIDQSIKDLKTIGCSISEKTIRKKLKNTTILSGYMRSFYSAAAFNPSSNSVILRSLNKRVENFHEIIHAISKVPLIWEIKNGIGFIEGCTELSAQKLYRYKKSSKYSSLEFNFRDSGYREPVCIVDQMEYLLGKSCIDATVLGNSSFFNEFRSKYGKNIFIYLKHELNKYVSRHAKKTRFYDVENKLLTCCFDKELENVKSIEDAEKYLERLNKFGGKRARPVSSDDPFLHEYYDRKLVQIKEILLSLNIDEKEIDDMIKNHSYKKVRFNPLYFKSDFKRLMDEDIRRSSFSKKIPIDELSAFSFQSDKNDFLCVMRDGEIIEVYYYNNYKHDLSPNKVEIINGKYYFEGKEIELVPFKEATFSDEVKLVS
jgi:hypothetical protein